MGKFLSDAQYAFTLEPYADGTPAPTVVTKEADMDLAAPFLLTRPDFSKTEVVKAYTYSIVAPVMDYWKQTIEVKKSQSKSRKARELWAVEVRGGPILCIYINV